MRYTSHGFYWTLSGTLSVDATNEKVSYIFNEDMIANMHRKESEPFTEAFIRRSNHGPLTDHTVFTRSDTVHIATQYAIFHQYRLKNKRTSPSYWWSKSSNYKVPCPGSALLLTLSLNLNVSSKKLCCTPK